MRSIDRAVAALLAAALAPTEVCAAPRAKLVSDAPVDRLQVSGTRPSTDDAVLINGHQVAVEGGRHWRVRLPLETLRRWSRPGARTIHVTVATPAGDRTVEHETDLPVGLLGGRIDLAALVVRLH